MDELELIEVSEEHADRIKEYIEEFPADRMRVTYDPERIPGLDHYEDYGSVPEWLAFCRSMAGRITWYMSVRRSDGKTIGFVCLRHKLEYDDDDEEFASHIGYSVRPSERRRGYGVMQLRLALQKAKELGLGSVRIVCRDTNTGSNKVILACGGVSAGSVYGEDSGMTVNRYDISLK